MAKGTEFDLGSFEKANAITLADSDQAIIYDAFFVGTAGNLAAVDLNDNAVTLKGLLAGTVYPIKLKQFKSTGSTAADIVGLRY